MGRPKHSCDSSRSIYAPTCSGPRSGSPTLSLVNGDEGIKEFVEHFPRVKKTVTHTNPDCIYGWNKDTKKYDTPVLTNTAPTVNSQRATLQFCTTAAVSSGNYQHVGGTSSFSTEIPDEQYLRDPSTCIVCYGRRGLTINKKLQGTWLHWRDLNGAPVDPRRAYQTGDVLLGQSDHYELYADGERAWKFVEFSMAILAASTQADQAPASGAAGAGGKQPQMTNATTPYILTLPIGP
jgi:hypothetical protein